MVEALQVSIATPAGRRRPRRVARLAGSPPSGQGPAREFFGQAKDIPKARLAYAWLRAGDLEQAEKLAREAAARSTNQLYELVVRCDVLWQAGKTNEAMEAFAAVRAAGSFAELDLPPLRRLRPVADALRLPADWRLPHETPSDLGATAVLDTLGPRLWQPYDAPAWTFADAEGGSSAPGVRRPAAPRSSTWPWLSALHRTAQGFRPHPPPTLPPPVSRSSR
jgi:hypothetical protein